MWKPGTTKPSNGSTRAQTPPATRPVGGSSLLSSSPPSRSVASDSKAPAPNSDSSKKRLSGATLNMRFMKRKKETQQHQIQQRGGMQRQEGSISSQDNYSKNSSPHDRQGMQQSTTSAMEIDDEGKMHRNGSDSTVPGNPYLIATPIDMYGVEGNMIGRRSYGGFNPAMEEAWKDSKAMIDNGGHIRSTANQKHISDEELLQRYREVVQNRDDDGKKRPIGNLRGKLQSKHRRR